MPLRSDIQHAREEAQKAKDTEGLSVLRMLWSAIRNEEIDKKKELEDADVIAVVGRQVKQLQDALVDFERGGRSDLIAKTKTEIGFLQKYLPVQLTDEELKVFVGNAIAASGAKNAADVGRVMALAMKEVKGKADGNRVRNSALALLG